MKPLDVFDVELKNPFSELPNLFTTNNFLNKQNANFDLYKGVPFTGFSKDESRSSLHKKFFENEFLVQLHKLCSVRKNVLEIGCGTGNLGIAISASSNNNVVLLDESLHSLKIGAAFAKRYSYENCYFVGGNNFDDIFKPNSFDVIVWSNVHSYSENPYGVFFKLLSNLSSGGYLIIRLPNRYESLLNFLKRSCYRFFEKYETGEGLHTLKEVTHWFVKNNIVFVRSIPRLEPIPLFNPPDKTSFFSMDECQSGAPELLARLVMLFSSRSQQGGLVIAIGKKS